MSFIYAIGAGLAAAGLIGLLQWRPWSRGRSSRITYQRREFLLSPEERLLYASLKEAVGEDYEIFGKVHLQDAVAPRGNSSNPLATVPPLSFLLCQRSDLSIACAVQLLAAGKGGPAPDAALRSICQSAGLPLVEVAASPLYDRRELRNAIAAALRKDPLAVTDTQGRREPGFSGLEDLEL